MADWDRTAFRALAGGFLAMGWAAAASAGPIYGKGSATFAGANGSASAQATFSIVGGNLQLVLENTAGLERYTPGDVLSGVFFNISGNPSLVPLSATASGGIVNGGGCSPACSSGAINIGGEWGYRWSANGKLSGDPLPNYGISASGYSSASPGFGVGEVTLFGNQQLDRQISLGGLNFGIVGSSYDAEESNGGTRVPLVKSSATFTWSGLPAGFSLENISGVTFSYGTGPDTLLPTGGTQTTTQQSSTDAIPEPSTWGILAGALTLFGLLLAARRGWLGFAKH